MDTTASTVTRIPKSSSDGENKTTTELSEFSTTEPNFPFTSELTTLPYQTTEVGPLNECLLDNDCAGDLACIMFRCTDMCTKFKPCGIDADCIVNKTRMFASISCTCPAGYHGNPEEECVPLPPSKRGCKTETECTFDKTCIDRKCVDPCKQNNTCGINAECKNTNHRAVCSCETGFRGDPYKECKECECDNDSDCPETDTCKSCFCVSACLNSPCIHNATCSPENHQAVCSCPRGYIGNPAVSCTPVECLVDSDCDNTEVCKNGDCTNPCENDSPCASQATCRTANHSVACYCPEGYTGDANIRCTKLPEMECHLDLDCANSTVCTEGHCTNPCKVNPCGPHSVCRVRDASPLRIMTCECMEGFSGSGLAGCRPIESSTGCRTDGDCPLELACLSGKCADPCGKCGNNAACTVLSHKPVCSCQQGFAGQADVACHKISCDSDLDCPSNKTCHQERCVNPCTVKSECGKGSVCTAHNHTYVCSCISGHTGDPMEMCTPVGCRNDSECPESESCMEGECLNPCIHQQICAADADCHVLDHEVECTCHEGYRGDPRVECKKIDERPKCAADADCPNNTVCIQDSSLLLLNINNDNSMMEEHLNECIDPCLKYSPCGEMAICSLKNSLPYRTLVCSCPDGYQGDGKIQCRPIPTHDMCLSDFDCLFDEACVDGKCTDSCDCGRNAQCRILNHRAICFCPPDYTGDPNVDCSRDGCKSDIDCSMDKYCVDNECVDPCNVDSPCVENALCKASNHKATCTCPDLHRGDPLKECIPVGCLDDTDCPEDMTCEADVCVDPCESKSPCGLHAICSVVKHKVNCTCEDNHEGSPYAGCVPQPLACQADFDCPSGHGCMMGICKHLCHEQEPCAENAVCVVRDVKPLRTIGCSCPKGFIGDGLTQCRRHPHSNSTSCTTNDDCSSAQACVNGSCVDPCNCGRNAVCHVVEHHPTCSCAPGYVGDAIKECLKSGCRSDVDCPDDRSCHNGNCINPCALQNPCALTAECFVLEHTPKCRCPSGHVGNPHTRCTPIGCQIDEECPQNKTCLSNQCLDPCLYDACALDAECKTHNHSVNCKCPVGYEGNPKEVCYKVQSTKCKIDGDCGPEMACYSDGCKNPCTISQPCGEGAECTVLDTNPWKVMTCTCPEGYEGDPHTQCRPIQTEDSDCLEDSDCPSDLACVHRSCRDPCNCGRNTVCQVINHKPLCQCRQGYEGNAHISCHQIGCESDLDCPHTEACIKNQCVDPCYVNNTCAINAVCYVEEHRHSCRCPSGMTGDPHEGCKRVECDSHGDCALDRSCIQNRCVDPCLYDTPCAPDAECFTLVHEVQCRCPSGLSGNPQSSCTTTDGATSCRSDQDCDSGLVCMNNRCIDPCSTLEPCDGTSECHVIDAKPVRTMICTCPAGHSRTSNGTCRAIVKPTVGCTHDSECPSHEACINGHCRSPCICGSNAECRVVNHRALCYCRSGYEGNPEIGCREIGCDSDNECSLDKMCYNRECVNPCILQDPCAPNAECYATNHVANCRCRSGYEGDGFSRCRLIGCRSNDECPFTRACVNRNCVDPCLYDNPCAPNANCYVLNHLANCRCPPHLPMGNPRIYCERIPEEKPECLQDADCGSKLSCIDRHCRNLCHLNQPCDPTSVCQVIDSLPVRTMVCVCREGYFPAADGSCRPIVIPPPGCTHNSECPPTQSCINRQCRDPCSCGRNAECYVQNHRPVCSCPEGYIGNPNIACHPVGCRSNEECPYDKACINGDCVNPCLIDNPCAVNAQCYPEAHQARCRCLPGYEGNPLRPSIGCRLIGCRSDSECPNDRACQNRDCVNLCLYDNPCAPQAECVPRDHRANCRCPVGYVGNPLVYCEPEPEPPECTQDGDCRSQFACIQETCQRPCPIYNSCGRFAQCEVLDTRPVRTMVCVCPDGYVADASSGCKIIPSIPNIAGCQSDGECPGERACVNYICVDTCLCGANAECAIVNHKPICYCREGYEGDPERGCHKVGCQFNSDCPETHACRHGQCIPVCGLGNEPCASDAICRGVSHEAQCSCPPGYSGNPRVSCTPIGCRADDGCPSDEACVNNLCVDTCTANPCNPQSECTVINHRVQCTCPPGYIGNPQTAEGCREIDTRCKTDRDCPNTLACIDRECKKPCDTLSPCGINAFCTVLNTLPVRTMVCECIQGYFGNAYVKCEPPPDCPFEKGFILNEDNDCVCPTENGFAIDSNGNCVQCLVNFGYKIDDDGNCVCDTQRGMTITEDGACVCRTDLGFVMTGLGECVCPTDRNFGLDEQGRCIRCPVHLGMKIDERGRCVCDFDRGYRVDRNGNCVCPQGYFVDGNGNCVPEPITEPIIPPECRRDEECPDDKYCLLFNETCQNPCTLNPCGNNAICHATGHKGVCRCIVGYVGNPYEGCVEPETEKPDFRTDFPRPEMAVNCLSDGVQVDINVGNSGFNGVLYVKDHSKDERCRQVIRSGVDVGVIDFKVEFNTCGLFHSNGEARFVLVIQKHPKLVTYKAQAYQIKCVYNTGEKTINLGFNVSMLTTAGTIANTGPPPTCSMKICTTTGQEISSAEIGDALMLKVEVQPDNIYGGFARNCIAKTMDDDGENEYLVTDENGCSTDPNIFGDWSYDREKGVLVSTFYAFKFPSSNSIKFQCNIRVCFGRCQPVNCNGYDAFGRRKRQTGLLDVETVEIVQPGQLREEITVQSNAILTFESRDNRLIDPTEAPDVVAEEVCIPMIGLIIALIITALLALVAVAIAVSCWLMAYRKRPKSDGPLPHPPEFPNPLFTTPEPVAEPLPDYMPR